MKEDIKNDESQELEDKAEAQELYDTLCEELEGVIPEEILTIIKRIEPIEAAIMMLWQYGGCIRIHNPEVDLKGEYEFPEEVKELNDTIGSYSFSIAQTPFIALARAAAAEQDFNEEVIISRDLKGYVPIIIKEENKVKRVCLVDFKNHTLDITIGLDLRLDIDMTGSAQEQKLALADGMKDLEAHLDKFKETAENPPALFNDPEEEKAVTAWAKKHTYTIQGVFRASIDQYF